MKVNEWVRGKLGVEVEVKEWERGNLGVEWK
jgi:hypothetical protein